MGAGYPQTCRSYYAFGEGFFNDTLKGRLRRSLDNITRIFDGRDSQCVDLILRYLCYYYFPVCDLSTGVVTTSCVSTCNLIVNNQDCSNLLEEARDIINQISANTPVPNYDCTRTYDTISNPTLISEQCREIES